MDRNLLGIAPTIVAIFLLAGCATVPPPALSKDEAVSRVRTVYSSGASSWTRYELPANTTGTGPHDFYNLFVRTKSLEDAVYGISIATSGKVSHGDAKVSTDTSGSLEVNDRQQLSVGFGQKVEILEATFDRGFLERSVTNGAQIKISSSRGAVDFAIPDWMFGALLKVADQNDTHRRFSRELKARQDQNQQRRDLYVTAHPNLPEGIKAAILAGHILIGMSTEDARASLGAPVSINRTGTATGVYEQWVYGETTFLYFEKGILRSWQDSR